MKIIKQGEKDWPLKIERPRIDHDIETALAASPEPEPTTERIDDRCDQNEHHPDASPEPSGHDAPSAITDAMVDAALHVWSMQKGMDSENMRSILEAAMRHDAPSAGLDAVLAEKAAEVVKCARWFVEWENGCLDISDAKSFLFRAVYEWQEAQDNVWVAEGEAERAAMTQARGTGEAGRETQ